MWQVSFRDVKVFPLTRLSPEVTRLNLLNAVIFKLFICLFDFYHQNAPSAFRQFLQNLGYKTDKRRGAALNEVGVRDPGPPIFNFNFQTTSVEIQVFMKACIKSAILIILSFCKVLQTTMNSWKVLCRVYCIIHFIIHYSGYINVCIFLQHKLNIWYFWGLFYDLFFPLEIPGVKVRWLLPDSYSLGHMEIFGRTCIGTPLQYSCLENPMDRGAW